MKTNASGRALIRQFEGYQTVSYPDPLSALGVELRKDPENRLPNWNCLPGDPWTIGIGGTGKGIGPGLQWTDDQVLDRFESDLAKRESQVTNSVEVPINENQFAALVSLTFNIGIGALGTSTLLRKLNQGDTLGAAQEFMMWTHARHKEDPGLKRRRAAEQALFLQPLELKLVS